MVGLLACSSARARVVQASFLEANYPHAMGLPDRVNIEDGGKWNEHHSTVRAGYKKTLLAIMFPDQ